MEQHFARIPFPLLASREARISREKYIRKAIASTDKADRQWNFQMAMMVKRHEKQWFQIYQEDCCNV